MIAFVFSALMIVFGVTTILRGNGVAATHTEQVLDCHYVGTAAHTHDASCYDAAGNLVCPLPERELHSHDDSCYTETRDFACGLEEHAHSDACYDAEGNLVCGLDEHIHTDACYKVNRELTCGLEEVTETHVHGPGCYQTVTVEDEEPAAEEPAQDGMVYNNEVDVDSIGTTPADDASDLAEAADPELAETMPAQTFTHSIKNKDEQLIFRVDVDAPEGALPAGSTMTAEWVNVGSLTKNQQEAVTEAVAGKVPGKIYAQEAVDISFLDKDGAVVEPARRVAITFTTSLVDTEDKPVVAHIDDLTEEQIEAQAKAIEEGKTAEEAEPKRSAQALDELSDQALAELNLSLANNQIAVATDDFSTFVVNLTTLDHAMRAEGETVRVEIEATAAAGLPADATLQVTEIAEGTEEYESYKAVALETAGISVAKLARFFDINIVRADGSLVVPQEPVLVKVKLSDAPADEPSFVVRLTGIGAPVLMNTEVNNLTSKFDTDILAIFGVMYESQPRWNVAGAEAAIELPATGFAPLSSVATQLGIDEAEVAEFVADITGMESSSEHVFAAKAEADTTVGAIKEAHAIQCEYLPGVTEDAIAQVDATPVAINDWAVLALVPFEGEGVLTVSLADGETFVVKVTSVQPQGVVLTAIGDDYTVTVTAGPDAKIPADAKLSAVEYKNDTKEYEEYTAESENALGWAEGSAEYARLFDISIVDAKDETVHYQPAEGAAVDVKIELADAGDRELQVVHYAEEKSDEAGAEVKSAADATPEVMEVTNEEQAVSFETETFSMYQIIGSAATNLDGKTYAIVNRHTTVPEAVSSVTFTSDGITRLAATPVNIGNGTGAQASNEYIVATEDITLWTFTSAPQGDNWYYIQDSNGKYMNITNRDNYNGNATVSDTEQPIYVYPLVGGYAGEVGLGIDNYVNDDTALNNNKWLNAFGGTVQGGFGGWRNLLEANSAFRLYSTNTVVQDGIAYKVSLKELVDMANNGSNNVKQKVVIYTRIKSEQGDWFEYYAVAADGSLVRVHDFEDRIGWTTLESQFNHVEWDLKAYEDGGVLNGYFDFESRETDNYLIPSPNGLVKTDDPADDWDLGVNMPGYNRDDPTKSSYGSEIERWDETTHAYWGYKITGTPGNYTLTPAREGDQIQFNFAVVDHPDKNKNPDVLHPISTLKGSDYGISIKMYDFSNTQQGGWPPRSAAQTTVMGVASNPSTNVNATVTDSQGTHTIVVGKANTGLVTNQLGSNGYPTATNTNRSLAELFSSGNYISDASNLFYDQVYKDSGYFEYDSSVSYAWLDRNNNQFVLYEEVAAPQMEGNNSYYPTQANTPSAEKGNFFPLISLQSLLDSNSYFTDRMVRYDGDLHEMDASHPQYGDTLFKVPFYGVNDMRSFDPYYFGMTMEGDFYQSPNGKDKYGEDVCFEFNGDDDMWLYIDGVLVLDVGGCHGAVSGTINFATGKVVVGTTDAGYEATVTTNTTLRQIFQDVLGQNFDPSMFDGDTFADYSQHSFDMFYMERGTYASNLYISFNLPTVEPGTFVIEKELPEDVQQSYGHSEFAYQVFIRNNSTETWQPYSAPAGKSVTNEATGATVTATTYTSANGHTYNDAYLIKPGEALVFPVTDDNIQYYVREIGVDGTVYEYATINGQRYDYESRDGETGTPLEDLAATATSSTVTGRGRVVYQNVPHKFQVRMVKKIDSVVKDPDAKFEFQVQMESNITGAMTTYDRSPYYFAQVDELGREVKYFMYDTNTGTTLVETPDGKPFLYYSSPASGYIDSIPEDVVIVLPGLLPDTDFYVTESDPVQPTQGTGAISTSGGSKGYRFKNKTVEYQGAAQLSPSDGTVQNFQYDAQTGYVLDNNGQPTTTPMKEKIPFVTITNEPDGIINVEKKWAQSDYITEHGDIQVALFKKTTEGTQETLTYVDDTLRTLNDDNSWKTSYKLPSAVMDQYVVREVTVTYEEDGTTVKTVTPIDEGGTIRVSGETTTAGADQTNPYIVHYEEGTPAEQQDGTTKRDDVINNTPRLVTLIKTDGTGNLKLQGAVFQQQAQDGTPIKVNPDDPTSANVEYTSDANGIIFENKIFDIGTYYFEETQAPTGYATLDHRLILEVTANGVSLKEEGPNGITYQNENTSGTALFRFSVKNSGGVELPKAGGPGTTAITLVGIATMAISALWLVKRRRTAEQQA